MFKKEYLIKYIKLVDKEKTHRTVIAIGVSGVVVAGSKYYKTQK